MNYDFSGYVTRNNIKCSDGLTIRQNAFKDCDGKSVPLVWQHLHNDPENVLGHCELENREDGVYGYAYFNDTDKAKTAKELVKHGDINAMSIFANRLAKQGADVVHGVIREVSLVLAGANPGAFIDPISLQHADGTISDSEDEAVMYFDSGILRHEDSSEDAAPKNDKTIGDIIDGMPQDMQRSVAMLTEAAKQSGSESDFQELVSTIPKEDLEPLSHMNQEQAECLAFLVGTAFDEQPDQNGSEEDTVAQSDNYTEEDTLMHKNVFDNTESNEGTLSHDALNEVLADARRIGNVRDAFLEHGITDLEILFPEAKSLNGAEPELIARRQEWVSRVWNACKKTPFARIKSTAANLTADQARAKGYIKGHQKVEEQLSLLARATLPQTVYKLQKMDRDDIIDITDIDVVAWLKREMRMMLDEELSRAVLVGDGRVPTDPDKIKEDNIRPIYQDDDLYTIHYDVDGYDSFTSDDDRSNAVVDAALRARKDYRGSGTPVFYASADVITDLMLAKDKIGRRLYPTMEQLKAALRVSDIVEVPVFEGVTRTSTDPDTHVETTHNLLGLIVNLGDYTIGADKGGAVTMFDDFNIDFNKYEYLIETRCSGALHVPYSAIALEYVPGEGPTPGA